MLAQMKRVSIIISWETCVIAVAVVIIDVCGVPAPLIFQLQRSEAALQPSNELTVEYLISCWEGLDAGGIDA